MSIKSHEIKEKVYTHNLYRNGSEFTCVTVDVNVFGSCDVIESTKRTYSLAVCFEDLDLSTLEVFCDAGSINGEHNSSSTLLYKLYQETSKQALLDKVKDPAEFGKYVKHLYFIETVEDIERIYDIYLAAVEAAKAKLGSI